MKSMTQSEKWLLVVIFVLLVLGCVTGYFAWQASSRLADVRMQASDASRQVEMMEARLAKAVSPPDLATMNRAIPADWEMPRFFADVTLLANAYDLQIHAVTPGEPIQPEPRQESQSSAADGKGAADEAEGADKTDGGEETDGAEKAEKTDGGGDAADEHAGGKAFSPEPPASLSGVYTLPLTLQVKGNITEVLAFIDELQHLPRLVWVTGFELLVEDEEQDAGKMFQKPIDLKINLNLYSHAPWDVAGYTEDWPFDIQPADNEEAFDAP
ncbi:MAG: hypothetical protein BAA01_09105 [Bacillus thermozeamaize]|uniref:Pilus assembly protein PilO n=1 Tax=Bacillus thermozeamaize TaxID=230954 RepID=A0A1Y3PM49_9BACI|nr:MAG: hypothetical protein BAA01_09105 [Bacillus thermozeamaize]